METNMVLGFEHFGLMAKDPGQLAAWYQEKFGLRVVSDNGKNPPTIFVAGMEGPAVEIQPYSEDAVVLASPGERRGVHLAIRVADFDQAYVELKTKGLHFCGEPKEYPGEGVKLSFFQDPEGNWGQIIYRAETLK